jgi:hypothetical protein
MCYYLRIVLFQQQKSTISVNRQQKIPLSLKNWIAASIDEMCGISWKISIVRKLIGLVLEVINALNIRKLTGLTHVDIILVHVANILVKTSYTEKPISDS